MRQRQFLVLVLVSFFIAIAHQFVVVWHSRFLRAILDTGDWGAWEQRIGSVGQICELGVLALLGFMLKGLGFKWTLVVGATAYLLRCLLFAMVFSLDPPFAGKMVLATAGTALHGFCFGCFLAVAYMYVDRIAPRDVRGSMQTFYGTFVVALGFFAGGFVSGQVGKWFSTVTSGASKLVGKGSGEAVKLVGTGEVVVRDWTSIWLSCAAICAVCVVVMVALFPKTPPAPPEEDKQGLGKP